MKKNLLFTFVTACMPGFGQMYYGYMRRGLSLAIWFYGLIAFSSLSGLGFVAILLPVIWAYSFFDTFNIRSLSPEQYAAFGDDYLLPNRQWAQRIHLDRLLGSNAARKVVGWILIIFGCLIIYNAIFANLIWRLYDYFPFIAIFVEAIPPLFIAGVVILLGLCVLKGKKPGFLKTDDADDYKNWQSAPKSESTTQTQPGPGAPQWDARTAPSPAPTWNFSVGPDSASPLQTAAPVPPVTPVAPVQPMAPVLETPAPIAPPAEKAADPAIVLTLQEEPTLPTETPSEDTAKAAADKPAPTAPEASTAEEEAKPAGKKGKKKDKNEDIEEA